MAEPGGVREAKPQTYQQGIREFIQHAKTPQFYSAASAFALGEAGIIAFLNNMSNSYDTSGSELGIVGAFFNVLNAYTAMGIYEAGREIRNTARPRLATWAKAKWNDFSGSFSDFYKIGKYLARHAQQGVDNFLLEYRPGLAMGKNRRENLDHAVNTLLQRVAEARDNYLYISAKFTLDDSSPQKRPRMAIALARSDRMDEAVEELQEWLRQNESDKKFQQLKWENSWGLLFRKKRGVLEKMLENEQRRTESVYGIQPVADSSLMKNFYEALVWLGEKNPDEAVHYLRETLAYGNTPAEGLAGAGILLHGLGYRKEGKEAIIEAIRKSPGRFEKRDYYPGSKSAWIAMDRFWGSVLVLKQRPLAELQKESIRLSRLEARIKKYDMGGLLTQAHDLGIIDFDGNPSLATLQADAVPLSEAFVISPETQEFAYWAHGFHQGAMSTPDVRNPGPMPIIDSLLLRLEQDNVTPDSVKQAILDNFDVTLKFTEGYPFLVDDADAKPDNRGLAMLHNGKQKIIFWDEEQKGMPGYPGHTYMEADDAKMFFHGPHVVRMPNSWRYLEEQAGKKNETFNLYCPEGMQVREKDYLKRLLLASIPKAVTYVSYQNTLENPTDDGIDFIDTVSHLVFPILQFKYINRMTSGEAKKIARLGEALHEMRQHHFFHLQKMASGS
ncbi:hypothetical protein J4227_07555 [Candidatus Woesearchaeota archaeon]|nr:hypothetical protein [Candidatus Woesearchaeota archaeon]